MLISKSIPYGMTSHNVLDGMQMGYGVDRW